MRKLLRTVNTIDALSKWSGYAISFLIVVIVLFIATEVVARYIFNAPTIWATESTTIVFGIFILLSGAYVLLVGGHVSMDAVYSRLSLRKKAVLDVLTFFFFLVFCSILLWKGTSKAIDSVVLGEHSMSVWGAPYWPPRVAIPLGAFLLLLQGLAKLIRDFHIALTGRKLV